MENGDFNNSTLRHTPQELLDLAAFEKETESTAKVCAVAPVSSWPSTEQMDSDLSQMMNRVLDEIESSHVTWSEKQELYLRIETLIDSNSMKDAQIDKLTRQKKLDVDDV